MSDDLLKWAIENNGKKTSFFRRIYYGLKGTIFWLGNVILALALFLDDEGD